MLISVFVVLIWILPIYAMDLGNTTSNLSINSTKVQDQINNHSVGYQNLYSQLIIKSTSAGKYKDMQDLRLRILQILEGMRLLRQQNNTQSVRYYTELETEYAELERLKRSMIKC